MINTALSGVSWLVENYEKAGRILLELAGTYGVYKAALIALNAVEKLRYRMTLAHMAGLTSMQAVMTVLKEKTAALNKTMLANPYVLAAAAVAGLAYGIYRLYTRETEAERVQRQYNEAQEAAARREEEHKAKVDELVRSIEDETTAQTERAGVIETLKQIYPGIIERYIDEEGHLRNLIALKKELSEFEAEKKVNQNQTNLRSLDERIKNQEEYIARMRTSDQSAFDDQAAVLEELKRQREIARQKVASDYANKSISAAKSMSDDELRKTIESYRKALSQHTGGEWFDSDREFKTDEVRNYVSALENLLEARSNAVKDKSYWETKRKRPKPPVTRWMFQKRTRKSGTNTPSKYRKRKPG